MRQNLDLTMKAMFEKVLPTPDSSWRYQLYELEKIPFNWHYHPEYEICLTLNSRGQRYIGDHIGTYEDYDLVLLGPKLPHTWCSSEVICGIENKGLHRTYVAQAPAAWVESFATSMPEMDQLNSLLDRSRRGIVFSKKTARAVAATFQRIENADSMTRFIGLFEMFKAMVDDMESKTLSSSSYSITVHQDASTEKIDKVIHYIHEHYTESLKAKQLADLAHMSTNHFHRFIKQRTEKTFTELVNQLRIGKACSLLINTRLPIANISDQCGFNNISNFNRRFSQFKFLTPSAFRKAYAGQKLLT